MEAAFFKIAFFIGKVLVSIPLIVCIWIFGRSGDDLNLNDWFQESEIDVLMNVFSIFYLSILSASKLKFGNLNIHEIFEGVFFYIGGIGSLIWIAFKLKLAYLDMKIKRHTIKEQEAKKDI